MAEINKINEERLKKFRAMGMPVPLQESLEYTKDAGAGQVAMTAMKNLNADPEKLKKLEAIRNGSNRNKFKEILEKAEPRKIDGFQPLLTSKQKKNPNAPTAPKSEIVVPLQSFSPTRTSEEAGIAEMFGEDSRSTAYSQPQQDNSVSVDSRRIPSRETLLQEEVNDDQYGTNFIQKLKAKRASALGVSIQSSNNNPGLKVISPIVQPHLRPQVRGLSEIELENKIVEIATEIATSVATEISKNMIKKVISEYAKDGSGIIIEGKNIKKAELVGNGVVKIAGKIYKLVPVKDKS